MYKQALEENLSHKEERPEENERKKGLIKEGEEYFFNWHFRSSEGQSHCTHKMRK